MRAAVTDLEPAWQSFRSQPADHLVAGHGNGIDVFQTSSPPQIKALCPPFPSFRSQPADHLVAGHGNGIDVF